MITLLEALALVILVVFIFLQGFRATLIPLLAVPVSLIGTFMLFPALGFSINTLSLFGLVLAIGIVVDDAIVVVEAVELNIENGMSSTDAALRAMEQVTSPIVATTLILVAVFLPTAFIPGITGSLYQQFAVTIAVSVVISSINALTLSPALSALLLRPRTPMRGPLGRFFGGFNNVFDRATNHYVGATHFFIRKLLVALGVLAGVAVTDQLPWIQDRIEAVTGIDTLPASVYQFSTLPTEVDPLQVAIVVGIAMVLSLGATWLPSLQGARLDPAEALRYE